MKFSILIIFLLFSVSSLFSQIEKTSEFETDQDIFTVDNLGNFYFIKGSTLTKTDSEYAILGVYDNKSFGELTDIDATDPFRVLLFYHDFSIIIFVDNYLAPLRDPINLYDLEIDYADAVCSSSYNGFRVYETQNSNIKSFDKNLKVYQTGSNLYPYIKNGRAIKIRESNNYVFMHFENYKIVILDKFGSLYKNPEQMSADDFDYINDELFLLKDSIIYRVDENWEMVVIADFSGINIRDFEISPGYLFILTEKSLITFKIL